MIRLQARDYTVLNRDSDSQSLRQITWLFPSLFAYADNNINL